MGEGAEPPDEAAYQFTEQGMQNRRRKPCVAVAARCKRQEFGESHQERGLRWGGPGLERGIERVENVSAWS